MKTLRNYLGALMSEQPGASTMRVAFLFVVINACLLFSFVVVWRLIHDQTPLVDAGELLGLGTMLGAAFWGKQAQKAREAQLPSPPPNPPLR